MQTAATMSEQLTVTAPCGEMPLYAQYPSQIRPQDAYLVLDPRDRTFWAESNPETGNAVPVDVYAGHVQRLSVPCTLSGEQLAELMIEVAPQLAEACGGYQSRWNGSNMIGVWSPDAEAILESVRERLGGIEPDRQVVSDLEDWFDGARDDIICEVRSGADRYALAEKYQREAREDGFYLAGDVADFLRKMLTEADAD